MVLSTAFFHLSALLIFGQDNHAGTLNSELVPNQVICQTEPLQVATVEQRSSLPAPLAPDDLVFAGLTPFRKKAPVKLVLIEPSKGAPYLFADVNQNGSFEGNERFTFEGERREVVLRLPVHAVPYRYYPIRLSIPGRNVYLGNSDRKAGPSGRTLYRSPFGFVEGTVDIGGQKTKIMFMFDPDKNGSYADWGWQGMDENGDGRIDERANSSEWTFASDETVIFRVNGRDVSTTSIDLKSGKFLVREHSASDNRRISLRLGEHVPDFQFTDLNGKLHQLAEFHDSYVLLDFWGTWCGPCRRELPDLEAIYRHFRSRGLVVLGMGDDKDVNVGRKALSNAGVTYPQSSGEAGNDLVHKRFRVAVFPTKMLLNPERKIIALNADGLLDREQIESTLDKLLPPAK